MNMNLQQLRYLCGVVQANFSISQAARELHTSQPGISKQIQLLEEEIGIKILAREGNRISGLTDAGKRVYSLAQRMLIDVRNLKNIGNEYRQQKVERLSLGTTHAHARYTLMPIISKLKKLNPEISIEIQQGNPFQIAQWILKGDIDLGICAPGADLADDIIGFPCGQITRSIFVPNNCPLLELKSVSLKDLAKYPLLTLNPHLPGGSDVILAFEKAGLSPKIMMSAIDADVIKAYIQIGHGIAILPSIVFDKALDIHLKIIDGSHLFPASETQILLMRDKYLRPAVIEFINMIQPNIKKSKFNQYILQAGL